MRERTIDPRRFRSYELPGGWTVVVGRTDRDNDELSVRFRSPKDYWFHVAGMPGSHVLLLHDPDREPDAETLKCAASIAAWHSRARNARRARVHVTLAANVRKIRGSPAGEVTIRRERGLDVVPGLPDGTDRDEAEPA